MSIRTMPDSMMRRRESDAPAEPVRPNNSLGASPSHDTPPGLDVRAVRADFPILTQEVNGKPLVYLDNAASTQKPRQVLDAIQSLYTHDYANVHRGVHTLSQRATAAYEAARVKVQRFLNAAEAREIVFTRGTTEAINLVAQTFGRQNLGKGDEVIISHLEHHSNIVPWQMICEATGAVLRVVPINAEGELILEEYERLLSAGTKIVAIAHLSNALGTVNPVRRIIQSAHARGVPVLLDGAQAASHLHVDVRELDCDFFAFSGHKIYGPTGIGVLYGKAALLERMPPYQGGGDMIKSVTFAKTIYADLPNKFEAGTPHIAGAVGLGAAIDYVHSLGLENIAAHEDQLLRYATEQLRGIPGVRILGDAVHKAALASFVVEDPPISTLDVGAKLDLEGIAVRTGHHCCQPAMDRYGVSGTVRASFGVYNTNEEIDRLATALKKIIAEAASRAKTALPLARPDLTFPSAAAASPQEAADELAGDFELFDHWDERYHYLLELGEKIPPLPEEMKTEANRVHGCQSIVHLVTRVKPGTKEVVEFLADSNADLVRGLIAILEKLFSGQRAEQLLSFDVGRFFGRIGLDQNLTLGRRNGLAAMVQRIRKFAANLTGQPS
jgi:cysteine desulfurase/selenocysteine lyase